MSIASETYMNLPVRPKDDIELTVERDGRYENYVSRVVGIEDDGIVIVEPISERGNKFDPAEGIVRVLITKDDALYRFTATARPFLDEFIKRYLLYDITDPERIQRREFARIEYSINVKYKVVDNSNNLYSEENWISTVSTNLSAGGLLIELKDNIKLNDILLVRLENLDNLNLPSIIPARCRRLILTGNTIMAGIEFISREGRLGNFDAGTTPLPSDIRRRLDPGSQNRLIRFVFQEQVKENRKRLVR